MSRPLLYAITGIALIAARADAQGLAAQRARVAELQARWAAYNDSLATMVRNVRPDTVVVGHLRLLVHPSMASRLEEGARVAWTHLAADLGKTDQRLLDDWLLAVEYWGVDRWAGIRDEPNIRTDTTRSTEGLAQAIEDMAWSHLLVSGGEELVRWTNALHPRRGVDYFRISYEELVRRPSKATRFCYQGETDWCAKALGLADVKDRWRELTTAADRRILLSGRGPGRQRDVYNECQSGSDDACLQLTEGYPLARLLSNDATAAVILVARELAGDGALTRLLADSTAPLAARVASAAGVPLDSLLSTWHSRVMAARPHPSPVSGATAWMTLFVAGVFATLALRSSRWRLD